jgi:hypothetical protein
MVLVISYASDPVPMIQLVPLLKDIHLVSHPQEIGHLRVMMVLVYHKKLNLVNDFDKHQCFR